MSMFGKVWGYCHLAGKQKAEKWRKQVFINENICEPVAMVLGIHIILFLLLESSRKKKLNYSVQ
jgi:hypothetical protein